MNPSQGQVVAGAIATQRKFWEQVHARQVATILRRDVRKGKDATHPTTYKAMPTPIRCRVMTDSKGAEIEDGEQIVSVMAFQVRFPVGSDIRDTDRIQIGNEIYSVVATDPDRADALFLTASCTRVKD